VTSARNKWGLSIGVAAAAVAAGAASAYAPLFVEPNELLIGVAGLILTICLLVVALVRFDWAILGAVLLRISLDGLKSGSGLAPGTAISAAFLVLALVHLALRSIDGEYRPASAATKSLYALAGAACLSTILSPHPTQALTTAAQVLSGALMFGVLEQELPDNPELARRLLIAVFASAVVPFGVGLFQIVSHTGIDVTAGVDRIRGTAVHPTPFASYISIIILTALALPASTPRRKLILNVIFGIGVVLLFYTYTRGTWIAAAAGIVFLTLKRGNRRLAPIILLCVAGVLFLPEIVMRFQGAVGAGATPESSSLIWRFDYWSEILPLASHNPITGIGLGVTELETQTGLEPHNVFLQAYVELGIVGVLALVGVGVGFWRTTQARLQAARDPEERAMALLMGSLVIMVAVVGLSSNVLTQAMVYWYVAAACLFGYASSTDPVPVAPPRRLNLMRSGRGKLAA
jgi:putative inorganic carbon (hco3(-)) transporter